MSKRWETVCVLSIDGELYSYQQMQYISNRGKGKTTIPQEEHKLVPLAETIIEENREEVLDRHG